MLIPVTKEACDHHGWPQPSPPPELPQEQKESDPHAEGTPPSGPQHALLKRALQPPAETTLDGPARSGAGTPLWSQLQKKPYL